MASRKSAASPEILKKDAIDPNRKLEAQLWIQTVLGVKINNDLFNELKDGTILCEVLNKIQSGTCSKYKKSKIPFVCRNNIAIFIKGARKLGIPATDMFETRDLYDAQRLSAVLQTLYSISAVSRKLGFSGPFIGVSYSEPHKRNFTKAQLAKAKSTVPLLNRGNKAKFNASKHSINNKHKSTEGAKKYGISSQHQLHDLIKTKYYYDHTKNHNTWKIKNNTSQYIDSQQSYVDTEMQMFSYANICNSLMPMDEGFQKTLSHMHNPNLLIEGNEETKFDNNNHNYEHDKRVKNNENEGDSCKAHEYHCNVSWHAIKLKQLEEENRILKNRLKLYTDNDISQAYTDIATVEENKNSDLINATSNVKITRQLTKKEIPDKVDEEFSNTFDYMNKYMHIYHENAIDDYIHNDKAIKVINCNINCKKTQEPLYVVCEKKNESKDKLWKTIDDLYSTSKLEQIYKISKQNSFFVTISEKISTEIKNAKEQIINILKDKILRDNIIGNKNTPWNNEDKIPIFNKTSKQNGLTLQLEKHQFVQKLKTFADQNVEHIQLVPIVRFNNKNKYFYEIVWIVEIEKYINIGISFKYINKNKYLPSAIYLDIYDQHKLVAYKHDCQCLASFNCIIDRLQIGESKKTRIYQRYKSEMEKKMTEYLGNIDNIKSICSNLQHDLQSLLHKQNKVNQQQNRCHQLHVFNSFNTLMLTPQPISTQVTQPFQNYNNVNLNAN